jgi:hypothetical protein
MRRVDEPIIALTLGWANRCDTARHVSGARPVPDALLEAGELPPAVAPADCIQLRVEGTDAGSLVRGSLLLLEREGASGWKRVHMLVPGRSASAAPPWKSYGTSKKVGVTLVGYRGTAPLYVRLPPVAPGDYRLRLDLVHGNLDVGDIRARTATLYAPLRIVLPVDEKG